MTEGKRGAQVKYLRQWRRHLLMTQAELADKAGITKGTIIRAEAGGYTHFSKIRAIADALGTTPQQLLAGLPEGYIEVLGVA